MRSARVQAAAIAERRRVRSPFRTAGADRDVSGTTGGRVHSRGEEQARAMEPATAFRVTPSEGEKPGAFVAFPYDRELVQRFRETFPRARWRDEEACWFVPGTTAPERLDAWLSRELEALDRHADAKGRDAFAFDPLRSPYLQVGDDLRVRTPIPGPWWRSRAIPVGALGPAGADLARAVPLLRRPSRPLAHASRRRPGATSRRSGAAGARSTGEPRDPAALALGRAAAKTLSRAGRDDLPPLGQPVAGLRVRRGRLRGLGGRPFRARRRTRRLSARDRRGALLRVWSQLAPAHLPRDRRRAPRRADEVTRPSDRTGGGRIAASSKEKADPAANRAGQEAREGSKVRTAPRRCSGAAQNAPKTSPERRRRLRAIKLIIGPNRP